VSVLLQISDLHFGTEIPEVVDAVINFANASKPAVIVLSGDITQRARRAQFAAAGRFCQALGPPVLLPLPGNHDIPLFNLAARIFYPYFNYRRQFGNELGFEYCDDSFCLLGLNTTRPWRHVNGEVSPRQVEWAAAQLRAAQPGQLRIVVTHQPVHVIREQDNKNLLRGHERASRAWAEAGADLILGGHIHLPHLRALSDRFNDLPRRVWSLQAGTATSWRIRYEANNSMNLIRMIPGEPLRCLVERWDFSPGASSFQLVQDDTLLLDRTPSTD
jgi:3',5'-cyclic AMP phosphodiesterase CpdA